MSFVVGFFKTQIIRKKNSFIFWVTVKFESCVFVQYMYSIWKIVQWIITELYSINKILKQTNNSNNLNKFIVVKYNNFIILDLNTFHNNNIRLT